MGPRQIRIDRQCRLIVQAGGGRIARLAQQVTVSNTRRQVIGVVSHRLAKRLPRGREVSAGMCQGPQFRERRRMPRIEVQRIEIGLPGRRIVAVREQPAGLLQRALDHVSRFWKYIRWYPAGQSSSVPNKENPIFS